MKLEKSFMQQHIKEIAKRYGTSVETIVPLEGGYQNEIYAYEKHNETYVIRLSKHISNRKEMMEEELTWITFLQERGVSVAKPIDSDCGNMVEVVDNLYVTSFQFVSGGVIDVTDATKWNADFFHKWGSILGKMHRLSKEFVGELIHRPKWCETSGDVLQIGQQLSPEVKGKYDACLQALSRYEMQTDTFGLIHNDFHQGNLLVDEDKITVIDFDDCTYNWFAYDIAVSFYHAYWQNVAFNGEGEQFSKEFLQHFLDGYEEENILHEDTLKQLPICLKIREIFLYQLFLKKWNLEHLEEWQQYTLSDLQKKTLQETPYAGIIDFSAYRGSEKE